jgi:citrate synthase
VLIELRICVNVDSRINMVPRRRLLTAAEAAAALGVRPATLYAYVSRGLLRSERDPRGRGSRYPAEDVEALARRAAARRDPPRAARGALDWGLPVLDSRLTLIAGGHLYYRGRDAVELARDGETLERVAALLWRERLDEPLPPAAPWRLAALARLAPWLAASRSWRPFQRLQAWLPLAGADDPAAYDLRPAAVAATGAWLLQLMAALAAGTIDHLRAAPPAAPRPAATAPGRSRSGVRRTGRAGKAGDQGQASASEEEPAGRPARAAEVLARAWVPDETRAGGSRRAVGSRQAGGVRQGGGARQAGGARQPGGVLQAGGARQPVRARQAGGARGPSGKPPGSAAGSRPAIDDLARLLDAALVLSADHELNVSTFTVRCVASAGAPPHAAVVAGLAALGGSRHGGQTERVEALLAELAPAAGGASANAGAVRAAGPGRPPRAGAVRDALAGRLRRGEEVPGFGHPLYPEGDPRARLLLELAAAARPASPQTELAAAAAAAAFELLGERPNIDFGLVTLARILELPAGAPLALFAIGRGAGWIAHAIEQYAEGRLIRPRARYVGPAPGAGEP